MASRSLSKLLISAAFAACIHTGEVHADPIVNGGFDVPTPGLSPPNYPAAISGQSASGVSSAQGWTLFNNSNATTSTELLPSTAPGGGGSMIHLVTVANPSDPTSSFFNGLRQAFSAEPGGTVSANVFAISGPVMLGLYSSSGSILINSIVSTAAGQWQTLSVTAPVGTNPDLVVLYSYSTSGRGEFYADGVRFTPSAAVPEPRSLVAALLAVPAVGLLGRAARRGRRGTPRA